MLIPQSCPRHAACSANICPLDPEWPKRRHLKDEPVCDHLHATAKPNGRTLLRAALPEATAETILRQSPRIAAHYPDIAKRLRKAADYAARS